MPRQTYPSQQPYRTHHIHADGLHTLYVEESGNPQGIPVLFVHGGPGGGTSPFGRTLFDPDRYRIVLMDQRGCGRSTPHAELKDNTTAHLIADMELIRQQLGIERWVLFGGSWGSTLSLAYAEDHPERVMALVLRGIFLCREHEIHWFYQQGTSRLMPDYWQDYLAPIPEDERSDLLSAYHKRLTGEDEVTRLAAAKAWCIWEGRCSTLHPNNSAEHFSNPHVALAMARIEAHYFMNQAFMEENQILSRIDRIRDIPGVIVHGRYDAICPVENAWELHQAWPKSKLEIVPDAGHSMVEPGIQTALLNATDAFADEFQNA